MSDWNIIGHTWAVQQMKLAVERGTLPHALLITGPESIGKETLALTIAQAMLCTATPKTERPCGQCSACHRVESGNHPDLFLVTPEEKGRGVKIDQIRELQRALSLTPNESPYKVGIITHFELATNSASNALLKTLEEPPAYAHLILLTTSSDLLLPTIVSRTQQLPLHPLNRTTVEEGLMKQRHISAARAQRLARLSGGRIGWAIQALDTPQHLTQMEDSVQLLFHLLKSDLPTRFDVAEELAEKDSDAPQVLEYWRRTWRDVLLLQSENGDAITHSEQGQHLEEIAGQVALHATVDTLHQIEATQTALRRNGNTRLHLEALVLNLPSVDLKMASDGLSK
jgi:DNA polymerase-3 subunit delta'